jgi:putative oxidoreductase
MYASYSGGKQLMTDEESTDEESTDEESTDEQSTDEQSSSRVFLLARLVFGGVLAFNAIDNLRELEDNIAYAKSKDAPQAEKTVPFATGALLFGSVGIVLWRVPRLAVLSVLTFLVPTTPIMHDFWNVDEDQKEMEQIQFFKNVGLIGGALAFLVLGKRQTE